MYWNHYPVGFLDEMLTVFDSHHHPVVLIGPQALCWMAVRLHTNQELDLLVRTSQQNDILQSLLASGSWIQVPAAAKSNNHKPAPTIPRLKHLSQDFHILLWSESHYTLKVDGDLCEIPHICAWNAVLAEPRFFHPPPARVPPHHVLPNPDTVCVPRTPDQTPPPSRTRTPIFIPTIPRYVNACLARIIRGDQPDEFPIGSNSRIEVSYLIRYLFLEMEGQRVKLLSMLQEEEQRKRMEDILNRYIRTVKADLQPGPGAREVKKSRALLFRRKNEEKDESSSVGQ